MSQTATRNWEWTIWDSVKRLAAPKLNVGDSNLLARYKDAWVREHRRNIRAASESYTLPEALLAGVSWIEVGGDPDIGDRLAFAIRSFDDMADPYLAPLALTRRPETTSTGDVPMQVRRAAETEGDPWANLSAEVQTHLLRCLQQEPCNIGVVARHLRQLRLIDFGEALAPTARVIRITGTRYHRGPDLSLAEIEANTRYGEFILTHAGRFEALLAD